MDDQWSAERIQGYVRLVLPLMSRHGIPVTPENYSLWYKYISGADSKLSKEIETMLRNGDPFSPETNETLYGKFCKEKENDELRRIRGDLHQVLITLIKQVLELSGHAEEYESSVSDSVAMLSENTSLQDIRDVVNEIINKTKTLGEFNRTLQHQLKETKKTLEVLRKDFEQVKTEVLVDFLTGLANRKAFDETLTVQTEEALAASGDLSLLIIDIDHFKRFNDTYGHLTGDEVLKFVAKKLKETVRGRDFVARFGGEEFAVLLPRTSLAGAETVAESIRSFFAQAALKTNSSSRYLGILTVSIGVASYHSGESPEKFVSRCDQALYSAKKAGRNRVVRE